MGTIKAEDGSLIEQSKSHAAPDADLGNGDLNRRFTTVSASAGASGQILDGRRIGANVTRSARAPSAEELFANGPHAGTQAFEIGDRSEEHTSELQSLMSISYAVFRLKKTTHP